MADPTTPDSHYLRALPAFSPRWAPMWDGFPSHLTPLIGREREIAALSHLLRQAESRLISLTGPGGVGKTRLAIAVATACADAFPDGAVFISLSSIRDPALLLSAIARALDIQESPRRPLAEVVAAALRGRRLLLLLDNFEHLMAAAPDVANLVATCPALTVLATSRAPLRLSAEQRFVTPPLALPEEGVSATVNSLAGQAAIALFVERARWVQHSFALTEKNAGAILATCQRLDGLPLAIELAAAWMRVLSPEMLLARLEPRLPLLQGGGEDQPARLRTMRDAIAWSYDLLTPDEACLFRRLAIFVGGFTLDATEAVGSWPLAIGSEEDARRESASRQENSQQPTANSQQSSVLDLLASLIDKSLLQVQTNSAESRFLMLETVREYALERLAESDEAEAVSAAHAAFMARFVERAEPELMGPQERLWLRRCNAELGNIRAALTWALAHDNTIALRIAAALWVYWFWELAPEGFRWTSAAVERIRGEPTLLQARAFTTQGALAALTGDARTCAVSGVRAIALASETGNPVLEGLARWIYACSYLVRAAITSDSPDLDRALPLLDQATTPTVRAQAALARSHRGIVAFTLGDLAGGMTFYEAAIARARAAGSDAMMVMVLGDFARWLVDLGDIARARTMAQEALALSEHHVAWLVTAPLGCLALVSVIEGDATTAARQVGAITASWRLTGLDLPFPLRQRVDRAADLARSALGDEAFTAALQAGEADPEAVLTAARGNTLRDEASAPTRAARESGLSARQLEVLALMVAGRSDQQIAEMLFISRRTASHHVAAIMTKLNAGSRGEAAVYGIRAGLI